MMRYLKYAFSIVLVLSCAASTYGASCWRRTNEGTDSQTIGENCPPVGPPGPDCKVYQVTKYYDICLVVEEHTCGRTACTQEDVNDWHTTCLPYGTAQWNGIDVPQLACWWGARATLGPDTCCQYNPPPPQPIADCDNGQTNQSGDPCSGSPWVISLRGGHYEFTNPQDGPFFDIFANGHPYRFSWPKPGSGVAFLVIDINGDGQINSGLEMFGDHASTAANAFDYAARSDSNGNNQLDEFDPVWKIIQVWTDTNADGVVQLGEMVPISQTDITGLGLDYHETDRHDQNGTELRLKGTAWRGGHAVPFYDYWARRQ